MEMSRNGIILLIALSCIWCIVEAQGDRLIRGVGVFNGAESDRTAVDALTENTESLKEPSSSQVVLTAAKEDNKVKRPIRWKNRRKIILERMRARHATFKKRIKEEEIRRSEKEHKMGEKPDHKAVKNVQNITTDTTKVNKMIKAGTSKPKDIVMVIDQGSEQNELNKKSKDSVGNAGENWFDSTGAGIHSSVGQSLQNASTDNVAKLHTSTPDTLFSEPPKQNETKSENASPIVNSTGVPVGTSTVGPGNNTGGTGFGQSVEDIKSSVSQSLQNVSTDSVAKLQTSTPDTRSSEPPKQIETKTDNASPIVNNIGDPVGTTTVGLGSNTGGNGLGQSGEGVESSASQSLQNGSNDNVDKKPKSMPDTGPNETQNQVKTGTDNPGVPVGVTIHNTTDQVVKAVIKSLNNTGDNGLKPPNGSPDNVTNPLARITDSGETDNASVLASPVLHNTSDMVDTTVVDSGSTAGEPGFGMSGEGIHSPASKTIQNGSVDNIAKIPTNIPAFGHDEQSNDVRNGTDNSSISIGPLVRNTGDPVGTVEDSQNSFEDTGFDPSFDESGKAAVLQSVDLSQFLSTGELKILDNNTQSQVQQSNQTQDIKIPNEDIKPSIDTGSGEAMPVSGQTNSTSTSQEPNIASSKSKLPKSFLLGILFDIEKSLRRGKG